MHAAVRPYRAAFAHIPFGIVSRITLMYRIPLRTRARAAFLHRKASFSSVRDLIAQRRRLRWGLGLALAVGLPLGILLLGAD